MTDFRLGPKARAAGYRLHAYDSIGSTNSEAVAAASQSDPGGAWFVAREQTSGRGRRGRTWHNPHGNLAATLLLVSQCEPAVAATLGFVAGVALSRALGTLLPQGSVKIDDAGQFGRTSRFVLKWPNDVLADGAKLAGILLEASKVPNGGHAVAIGIGVNVVSAPTGLQYPATSLHDLQITATAEDMFEALSDAWVEPFALWDEGRGIEAVLELWRFSAAGIGAPVAVNQNGDVVRGIFETIDSAGRLIVRADNDRRVAITAGDVHFGATASALS